MVLYSILVVAVAALIGIFGMLIYRGNTKLIHEYHMSNVKESERLQYARAVGKCLIILALMLAISGSVAFGGNNLLFVIISVAIVFLGLVVFIIAIFRVQKKYNNGIW